MRFFPSFALRDLFGWVLALGVLCAAAAFLPAELGEKADPFAPAFADIKPEWYFMFMFEVLKLVPGGEIMGIEYEAVPILFFSFAGLAMLLVPFLDPDANDRRRSRRMTRAGVVSLVFIVGMTSWGYRSLLPIGLVLATAALVLLMGAATRRIPRVDT